MKETRITDTPVVGYLTPEAQLQRALVPEPLTNREEIENLQIRLSKLMQEVQGVKAELTQRWEKELGGELNE